MEAFIIKLVKRIATLLLVSLMAINSIAVFGNEIYNLQDFITIVKASNPQDYRITKAKAYFDKWAKKNGIVYDSLTLNQNYLDETEKNEFCAFIVVSNEDAVTFKAYVNSLTGNVTLGGFATYGNPDPYEMFVSMGREDLIEKSKARKNKIVNNISKYEALRKFVKLNHTLGGQSIDGIRNTKLAFDKAIKEKYYIFNIYNKENSNIFTLFISKKTGECAYGKVGNNQSLEEFNHSTLYRIPVKSFESDAEYIGSEPYITNAKL